jgi:hypothetical protein
MYGYISIYFHPTDEEKKSYLYYYCGLCHSLKENFGTLYRPFIIKEVVFFMMLKNPIYAIEDFKCPFVHFKTRYKPEKNDFTRPYSFLNFLIIYGKLLDYKCENIPIPQKFINNVRGKLLTFFDEPFLKKYENYIYLQQQIEELPVDLDEYAKPSIKIMELLFHKFFSDSYPEIVPVVTAYLVYMLDGIYDFERDMKKNKFNAIAQAFQVNNIAQLEKGQKERLLFTYDLCAKELVEQIDNLAHYNNHLSKKIASFSLIYHRNKINKILNGGKFNERPTNYSRLHKTRRFQKPVFKIPE